MSNYQHILLAIDFSDDSGQVLKRTKALVEQNGARLSLIHVIEYSGTMYTGEIPLPEDLDLDQRLAQQARERLDGFIKANRLEVAASHVEIGIPKREIVRVAQEQEADLVVVGSHGRHGLQLLLGSTANGVLHLAQCDVLAVRVGN